MVFNSFSKSGCHNYIIISDLSQRVDAVKDENLKLKSENQVWHQLQYSVPRGRSGGGGGGSDKPVLVLQYYKKATEAQREGRGLGVMKIKLTDFSA